MKIREEAIDSLYMDIIDLLGKRFDTTLDTAALVAEEITEKVNDIWEQELDNEE